MTRVGGKSKRKQQHELIERQPAEEQKNRDIRREQQGMELREKERKVKEGIEYYLGMPYDQWNTRTRICTRLTRRRGR
jgi:hypothetical protein